jgi:hypothetical protein
MLNSDNLKEADRNDVLDSIKARKIVKEIMDFGVNDRQLQKIIRFLSLELEDMSMANAISELMDGEQNGNKEILPEKKIKLEL